MAILARGSIIATGTPAELARQIAGEDEVRWTEYDTPFVRREADSTGFVRALFQGHGDAIRNLEVRRASLEDTYLALVREAEEERFESIERPAA